MDMDDMEFSLNLSTSESHNRVIVHVDIDCFYAQVEMVKNPELYTQPLGIQQKNIVVTSNYIARQYGITKCMPVIDAQRLCPALILVSGEDLHDYRQVSVKITHILQRFSSLVERLGLDENFVDVTHLVSERIKTSFLRDISPEGHVFNNVVSDCDCGCRLRLTIGSHIASEIRKQIKEELNLTTCAGIAHNKLLAKLVCTVHKPNQQTTLYPSQVCTFISCLTDVKTIPGIGHRTSELLRSIGISSVLDLQNYSTNTLQDIVGSEMARKLKDFSFGIDNSLVKQSGKPQSIGLEDGFRKISLQSEVKEKFSQLLFRLMALLAEDGRVPRTLKVTVRKYDAASKSSHRESRQCNISPSFFLPKVGTLSSDTRKKIVTLIMKLFYRMIDITKPFHLTLLGIAFTKFQERATGKSSITSFLLNNDISVQSVLDVQNVSPGMEEMECSSCDIQRSSLPEYSGSESDLEPSPKKTRNDMIFKSGRKRSLSESDKTGHMYGSHISKQRLSTEEKDDQVVEKNVSNYNEDDVMDTCMSLLTNNLGISDENSSTEMSFNCPPNVDPSVFRELPRDVQQEIVESYQNTSKRTCFNSPVFKKIVRTPQNNTILKYITTKK